MATDQDPTLRSAAAGAPAAASRIGPYPVLSALGEGGMGQVYRVYDDELERELAAKVVRDPRDGLQLDKFLREARITGQLQHPNIVPVHRLGAARDGQPYFTMKEVEGRTLGELLETPQSLVGLLQILLKVCDAVAFAHSRGVIHRDLKPANVMVGRFGEVLVLDWGLATRRGEGGASSRPDAGDPYATLDGTVQGTPAYMPPEQAQGRIAEIDERSDIYSLGAMLYELLALEPPFSGESVEEVLGEVAQGRLVPPSRRAPGQRVPWELEAVVLRAMAHEPGRRYATVGELQAEIERFLVGETLLAPRYGPLQRLGKWVTRHRALAGAAAAVIAIATVLGLVSYVGIRRERDEARAAAVGERVERRKAQSARAVADAARRRAEQEERAGRAALLAGLAHEALRERRTGAALVLLDAARRTAETPLGRALRMAVPPLPARFAGRTRLPARRGPLIAGTPDGRMLLTGDWHRAVYLWDAATGRLRCAIRQHRARPAAAAYSARFDRLFTASDADPPRSWHAGSGRLLRQFALPRGAGPVSALAASPDGRLLAGGGRRGRLSIWAVQTGHVVRGTAAGREPVEALVYAPGGESLASSSGAAVRVWDAWGALRAECAGHQGPVRALAFSPDGRLLAGGGSDGTAWLWEAGSGKLLHRLVGHRGPVVGVAFSAGGRACATAGEDRLLRLWDPRRGTLLVSLPVEGVARGVWPAGAGFRVAAGGAGDGLALTSWELRPGRFERRLGLHQWRVSALALSADGLRVLSGGSDGTALLWETASGRLLQRLPHGVDVVRGAALSADGRTALLACGKRLLRWQGGNGPQAETSGRDLRALALHGGLLATADAAGRIEVRRPAGRQVLAGDRAVYLLVWSPAGERLAAAQTDGRIALWDAAAGRLLRRLPRHEGGIAGLAFAPDGTSLYSAAGDGALRVWRVADGRLLRAHAHSAELRALAADPDGRTVWFADARGRISAWDAPSGRVLLGFEAGPGPIDALNLSADGRVLVSGGRDGAVRVWGLDAQVDGAAARRLSGLALDGTRTAPLDPAAFERLRTSLPAAGRPLWK